MAYIILADRPHLAILREAAEYLHDRGHRVDVTGNGNQALALAAIEEPNVMVLSFFLNDRDGFQVLEETCRMYPEGKTQFLWLTVMSETGGPAARWTHPRIDNLMLYPYTAWQMVLAVEQLIYKKIVPRT